MLLLKLLTLNLKIAESWYLSSVVQLLKVKLKKAIESVIELLGHAMTGIIQELYAISMKKYEVKLFVVDQKFDD